MPIETFAAETYSLAEAVLGRNMLSVSLNLLELRCLA